MKMQPGQKDPIEFPSDHIFKAVGDNRQGFVHDVHSAVSSVLPVAFDALKTRESAGGKYISVSIVARLSSRTQLEGIYSALRQIDGMKYLL